MFQPIRRTIKYQLGKANVVADALTRSERKEVEDSTNDLAISVVAIEEYYPQSVDSA